VNLQLYAAVFDEAYTKLVLYYDKERYTVWTNINFEYLRSISMFETDTRSYSYFGVATRVDRERENEILTIATAKGFNYTSRWEAPPVRFSEAPEYVLVTEDETPVPEEVYQQLDDLLGYYLANKETLRAEYLNQVKMQAARERYKAAHPEEPQDIILNFSRASTPAE
jgi:hypothetical protein